MDFDENDFQSQNPQLDVEGSTEFHPVTRPYSLPKFDFEDSLQEQLKFDSLVETEVFLGIESQEGNHWLEDFTRASGGIEFSARATESCTISRHSNAWSVVTCSESVEMLLKSVGQEEMIPGKAIEDSDVHDKLGNLANQMDPSEQGDDSHPIMADIVDSGPKPSSEKLLGSFPQLTDDDGGNLMHIKDTLQTHDANFSACRSPSNFDGSPYGSPAAKHSSMDFRKCNARTDDFSAAPVNLVTSTPIAAASIGVGNIQVASSHVCNVKADSIHGSYSCETDQHVFSKQSQPEEPMLEVDAVASSTGNSVNAVSSADSIHQGNMIDTLCKNVSESSVMMSKTESYPPIAEGWKVDSCSRSTVEAGNEVLGLGNNKKCDGQYKKNTIDDFPAALVGDRRSEDSILEGNMTEITCKNAGESSEMMSKNESDELITEVWKVDSCSGSTVEASKVVLDLCNNKKSDGQYEKNTSDDLPKALEGDHRSEDSILEGNTTEAMCKNAEKSSVIMSKNESGELISEVWKVDSCCRSIVEASKEVLVLRNNKKSDGQYVKHTIDDLAVALEDGDRVSEEHHIETGNSNIGTYSSLRSTQYSPGSVIESNKTSLNAGHQTGCENLASNSETSLLPVEDSSVMSHSDDDHYSSSGCSSPKSLCRMHGNLDKFKDFHDSCGTFGKESHSSDARASLSTLENPMPVCEKTVITLETSAQNSDKDNFVSKKGEAEFLTGGSNAECMGDGSIVVDRMLGCSSHGARLPENGVIIGKSKSKSPNGHTAGISLEDSVPLPGLNDVTNIEVIEKLCESGVRSPGLDKKEESGTNLFDESSVSTLTVYSENNAFNVAHKDEKDALINTDMLPYATTSQSLSLLDSSKVECHSRSPALVDKINREGSEELGRYPVVYDLSPKGVSAETTLPNNIEDGTAKASCELASLKVSDEVPILHVPASLKDFSQVVKQTSLVAEEFKGEQIVVPSSGGTSNAPDRSCASPEANSKVYVLEVGNGCEESVKPNCGSLTAIHCADLLHHEMQKGNKGSVDIDGTKEVCSVSADLKSTNSTKDDRSFSFEVDSSGSKTHDIRQLPSSIQAHHVFEVEQGSHISALNQMDSRPVEETDRGSHLKLDPLSEHGAFKNNDRKFKSVSGKTMVKKAAKKKVSPVQLFERGDKPCSTSPVPSEGLLHCGRIEYAREKTCGTFSSTSDLPDLNASTFSSMVFQQPFTDIQQLQLRAQIFVYGSLILGAAPDEACMAAAFGDSDGGRNVWESSWHTCVERVHIQKSHPSNFETPLPPRTGARPPDMSCKQGGLQSKVFSTATGQANNKAAPAVVNSMVALSSPLWSLSTTPSDGLQPFCAMPKGAVLDYNHPLSPLHAYQTPPPRNFVGHTSWPSQTSFSFPWIDSHQTALLDNTARFSMSPVVETVRLTPVRESSVLDSSVIKLGASSPSIQHGSPGTAQHFADVKHRKKKKIPASEDITCLPLPSQAPVDPVLATSVVTSCPSASVTKSSIVMKPPGGMSNTDELVTCISPSLPRVHNVNQNVELRTGLSKETINKVKEAHLQAEEAAAHAASAVGHSQHIWTQLDKQNDSGLASDAESALASAAIAVVASASVAKAAAAAAKIASSAALQAKLMADEALAASNNESSHYERASGATSIVMAARTTAMKRVDAASAASKQAENFDALVKAAVLVAEAVSQAGKVVTMGEPLGLRQLVEAGPEGCWKLPQASFDSLLNSNHKKVDEPNLDNIDKDLHKFGGCSERSVETNHQKSSSPKDAYKDSTEENLSMVGGILGSVTNSEGELGGGDLCKNPDMDKAVEVLPESEFGSRPATLCAPTEDQHAVKTSKDDGIKVESLVEVFLDGHDYKAAWFLAKVLSLEDGKAYVCFTELSSDDGLGQLKEWVALQSEGDKAPRVRCARPVSAKQVERTRKRQREAMGDYNWSVGDKVDAWMRDCWWEGFIAERDEKDETSFSVTFPAHEQTLVARAWHLRPSLVWKDGEWIEWRSRESHNSLYEVVHQEKRQRLSGPVDNTFGESGKPGKSKVLPLSANEKAFDAGKASRDGIKSNRLKTAQSGQQKEGTGVIFGIPKPGKKRKFMDVSKHYVAGQSNKSIQLSDSTKLAKMLVPSGSGSRSASRFDIRGKRLAESKPKSGKGQNAFRGKNNILNGTVTSDAVKVLESDSHGEGVVRKKTLTEFGSLADTKGGGEGHVLFSSSGCPSDAPSPKNGSTSESTDRGNREEDKVFTGNSGKSMSDLRRSNRRIQPTSRLLEGLQSSMIISKIPSVSHDRSHKSQNRGFPRGSSRG